MRAWAQFEGADTRSETPERLGKLSKVLCLDSAFSTSRLPPPLPPPPKALGPCYIHDETPRLDSRKSCLLSPFLRETPDTSEALICQRRVTASDLVNRIHGGRVYFQLKQKQCKSPKPSKTQMLIHAAMAQGIS